MIMNTRLSYEYLPYEVLYQIPDNFGRLSGHRVHSRFMSEDERDAAFDKLNHKGAIKYSKHTNEHELILQAKAMGKLK